jgi:HlyD family secretion protein
MKTILKWLLVATFGIIALAILASFAYLYKKSQANPIVWKVEAPEIADITKKTVATGSVVPRQSVDVKPKVTGVLSELYVEPGKTVKKGDALGKIDIIPDAQNLSAAEGQVRSTQITVENAKRELDREEGLFKQGVVAEAEVFKFRTDYALAKQQVETAQMNLQLVREGSVRGQGKLSNVIVTATIDGTVIDVPVKVGYSVIQANSFNPGTTVATLANMGDMIFDGHVDESEVAKIKEGMKLDIKIGAIDKDHFEGKLEYIAPQGKEQDGAIQFEIKAALVQKSGPVIRAGYSANADIVIDERKHVLAIREALVQYDANKPYVEVETAPQTFVRKDVQLGVSDGIKVEVLAGVTQSDKLKVPENAGPAKAEGSGSGSGSGSGGGSRTTGSKK